MRLFGLFRLSTRLTNEDDDLEEEEEDLCLLHSLDLCFLLDWSLLETCLDWDICLLSISSYEGPAKSFVTGFGLLQCYVLSNIFLLQTFKVFPLY